MFECSLVTRIEGTFFQLNGNRPKIKVGAEEIVNP